MNIKHHIPVEFKDLSPRPPFKVPDDYFDTLEDRIEARISNEAKNISTKGRLIRMIKPVFAMAASFALIFILVYYPLSIFLPDYLARNADLPVVKKNTFPEEEALLSYILFSEQSFYDVLNGETEPEENEVNAEDMLNYLTTAMNETEIYAELKN